MSKDLLLEIGSEEIPASFVSAGLDNLKDSITRAFEENRLSYGAIHLYGTPRRLTVIVESLDERQADICEEIKGPSTKAAFDGDGNPTRALEGFARSQGVKVDDMKRVSDGKGEYLYAVKECKGRGAEEILPEILEPLISPDLFKKTMRWSDHSVHYARPVHWILASYGGTTIPVNFGHVSSGSVTYGHRFLDNPGGGTFSRPIEVSGVSDYVSKLEEASVILDPTKRREAIELALIEGAKEVGGELLMDFGLLDEVVNLVEYPVVLRGTFDSEFLTLPRDIPVIAMREHQRYFSIIDSDGNLMPYFMTISNMEPKDRGVVVNGNERVLRARLSDAKFYFDKDRDTSLDDMAFALKGVVFQKKLGTSYEKVVRFANLALQIGAEVGFSSPMEDGEGVEDFLGRRESYKEHKEGTAEYNKAVLGRGAMLAKADLTSGVVAEFPKLQGTMGGVYGELSGEAPEVSEAISGHYRPLAAGGDTPSTIQSSIISIADKIDTICGCFSVGLIPTGTQDPYALRRQALGIIAIVRDNGFRLSIEKLVDSSLALIGDKATRPVKEVKGEVIEFFKERLKNQLKGEGYPFDAIDAVVSSGWYDMVDGVRRIKGLKSFKRNDECSSLVVAFKRVSNILKDFDAGERGPDESLFTEEAEGALYRCASDMAPEIEGYRQNEDYKKVFEVLAGLKSPVDDFFDKVMVMVDDEGVKENRLLLLSSVRGLYHKVADLSKLV